MRFFIDEDLSPTLVGECHAAGCDATSSRDRERLGGSDRQVAELCLDEERILVTNNARDFLFLARERGIHPGLIFMPLSTAVQTREWIKAAIAEIERLAGAAGVEPAELMINSVLEVAKDGSAERFTYP